MSKRSKIRCSVCGQGTLRRKRVDQDVGDLLGMKGVVVKAAPALVCSKCGEVTLEGAVLDRVSLMLAARILGQSELKPVEVRFLRGLLGDRQEDLARNLGVTRATVNRWEAGEEPISGLPAYAVRSHAFFRLRSQSPLIGKVASTFETLARERKTTRYIIEAGQLGLTASG